MYRVYAETRLRLGGRDSLAWTLRRFERDLLESLGSGFNLTEDGDGLAIDPAARYRIDPEQGPRRLLSDRGREERSSAATGSALLALAADQQPEAEDLASLRLALRSVLGHHLGGRSLKSWEMLGELERLKRPGPAKP
jgi:DNA repair protein RecO (recombination protein O)